MGDSSTGPTLAQKAIAEFIGTFMLVFSVGCNVITGSGTWAGLSIGCTLMVSIYALAGVSGANFNPAVSLSLGLVKELEWKVVGVYIGIQLLAGILAGVTYGLTLGDVFNLAPGPSYGWWEAALAEIIYTFMLCFVVLNVATPRGNNQGGQFYGLAIGFVVVAGAYAAGHISGAAFNPAVAAGVDVSSIGKGFGWCIIYALYEMIGAALAAALFNVVRSSSTSNLPKLVSEFLGTYMLVLTVGLNVIGKSPAPVLSIASALMCMIFAIGNVSGGHFNPAVTAAIVMAGRDPALKASTAIMYTVVQLLGGTAGAFTYMLMEHGATVALKPGKGYGWYEAWLCEAVFTFLLCYVVMCVATTKVYPKMTQYFGFIIGSCVTAGGWAIGAVSGGSLNPAVSTGLALTDLIKGGGLLNLVAYSTFELLGAVAAAVVFSVTHRAEYEKAKLNEAERLA